MQKVQSPKANRRPISSAFIFPALIAGGVIGYIASVQPGAPTSLAEAKTLLPNGINPNCNIKGNVSINTGRRIYHVPGQRYYDDTIIRPEYGERWFCSEAEAIAAGWRKSGV